VSYPIIDIYNVDTYMETNTIPEMILGVHDPEATTPLRALAHKSAASSQKERLKKPSL